MARVTAKNDITTCTSAHVAVLFLGDGTMSHGAVGSDREGWGGRVKGSKAQTQGQTGKS